MNASRLPRFLFPGAWLVPLMLVLSWVIDHGRGVGIPLFLVDLTSITFFIILTAAPMPIYHLAFGRGYRPWERIAASLVPLVWW